MHPKKQLQPLPIFSAKQFNCKNYQADQKNKNADAVYAMHVPDPFILWPVWIFLFKIKIFGYLVPDSHTINFR